jgi:glutamate--cysteine ligase
VPVLLRELTLQEVRDLVHERTFARPGADTVGIELELFPLAGGWDVPVPFAALRAAVESLGPLPTGSRITFEPGGQLELSTVPQPSVARACAVLASDLATVRGAASAAGIALVIAGSDPVRPPARVVDDPRYEAMEAFFDLDGHHGRVMMCSTAAIQVNLGLGAPHEHEARWQLAHAIGPTLTAAFANSPMLAGRLTGWKSSRLATWFAIDPSRTAPPPPSPAAYVDYALDARVMLTRDRAGGCRPVLDRLPLAAWAEHGHPDGWPTSDDVAYHLTTLFPPVRPKGWLEIRYLDAVPEPWWPVAAAVVTALVDDPGAAGRAREAVAGTEHLWAEAARVGLEHPALARSAQACFVAALDALEGPGGDPDLAVLTATFADRYVDRRRCPADDGDPSVAFGPYVVR